MDNQFEIKINASSWEEFDDYMRRNRSQFKLEYETAMHNGYSRKVFDNATRFEVIADGRLISSLCVYYNPETRCAFITHGCTEVAYRHQGLFSNQIDEAIKLARQSGMTHISVESYDDRHHVHDIFLKHGFVRIPSPKPGKALFEQSLT